MRTTTKRTARREKNPRYTIRILPSLHRRMQAMPKFERRKNLAELVRRALYKAMDEWEAMQQDKAA